MAYQHKDHYYRKAKKEGKASRAAYKIMQLQEKFRLVKRGDRVLDLGCAPGGWLQELSQLVGSEGKVVGIDLQRLTIALPKNVIFIQGSIDQQENVHKLEEALGDKANIIVSDMAPKTSGVAFADAYRSYELALLAFEMCPRLLKSGGSFIAKIFTGEELNAFRLKLKPFFEKVTTITPPATRVSSAETYVIGMGFRANTKKPT